MDETGGSKDEMKRNRGGNQVKEEMVQDSMAVLKQGISIVHVPVTHEWGQGPFFTEARLPCSDQ